MVANKVTAGSTDKLSLNLLFNYCLFFYYFQYYDYFICIILYSLQIKYNAFLVNCDNNHP